MLTVLYESILRTEDVTRVTGASILATDDIIVQFANNDPTKNHRIQIIEVDDPTNAPTLVDSKYQNPVAMEDVAPSTDGTLSCLAPSPKYNITCAGGTQSTYFYASSTDIFDIEINGVSYVGKTMAEIQALLVAVKVELVPMVLGT